MFNTYKKFDSVVDLHRSLTNEQLNCYLARSKQYVSKFPWSNQLEPIFNNCLVHASPHVPGKVAYFSSVENMMKNTTTRTSPEMFLSRFLSTASRDLQAAWRVEALGHILPVLKFIENTDVAGWLRVYEDGPQSCMAGSKRVRAYAHPNNNLALAYVEDLGKITYRAIVNRKKSTYLRIYGYDKDGNNSFMSAALNKAGFSRDDETLEGEIIYVYYEDCAKCGTTHPVGPYLDGSCYYVKLCSDTGAEGIIGETGLTLRYEDDVSYECECDRSDYYEGDEDD